MELPADTRANYLAQALHMANAEYPWLKGATIFNLDYASSDNLPKTSERYWFSLLTRPAGSDLVPTLAYTKITEARTSGYLPESSNSLDARSGIMRQAHVLNNGMELRSCDIPEPSHIHVPRPSRVAERQAQMPDPNAEDVWVLAGQQCDASAPTGID